MNKLVLTLAAVFLALCAVAEVTPKALELTKGKVVEKPMDFVPEIRTGGSDAVTVKYNQTGKKLIIIAQNYGTERIVIRDSVAVREILDINVRPVNWELFRKILRETPNIRIDSGEGKLLVSGKCTDAASVDRVRRLIALGKPGEIVDNTDLDSEVIIADALEFIRRHNFDKVTLRMLNRTVFVSGEVYDAERQKQLSSVLTEYFKQFNCSVNTNSLNITSRKIAVRVLFLDVDKNKLRQFGIRIDSPIRWDWALGEVIKHFDPKGLNVNGLTGTVDVLQENNLAKIMYQVSLSTVSGEKAVFQQGGVLNVRIYSQDNTDLKEIPYGFQVEATPYTINDKTIGLDMKMDLTRPKNENSWTKTDEDKDVSQYTTKSKYTMDAGSMMVISSFGHNEFSDRQTGLPWLSEIPLIGSWLFGSTSAGASDREILLLLTVDWEDNLKKENAEALKRHMQLSDDILKKSRSKAKSLRNSWE